MARSTSTLDHLNELQPQSTFDARRFRMNVIVATPAPWLRRELVARPRSTSVTV
jgi:hypothetical protein